MFSDCPKLSDCSRTYYIFLSKWTVIGTLFGAYAVANSCTDCFIFNKELQ